MSNVEFEARSKRSRRLCTICRERKARFLYHGHVRADRDHTLCFECYRAERNRVQSLLLERRLHAA